MSFILDALKKSELERQRQTLPGIMDPGAAPRRSRFPVWAAALGILLGINLLVLSIVLLRRGAAPGPTAAPPAARAPAGADTPPLASAASAGSSAAPVAVADSAAEHFSPMDGAASRYAPEIPLAESDTPTAHAAGRSSDAAPRPAESAKPAAARAAEESDEVLPSIDEVNLNGSQGLSELHLDVHVYATRASDRFVYINGHKYHEGMHLAEGPIVERIRRDGVVLNAEGIRFLLPRQ